LVETKGYDNYGDIPAKERWKIESARHFFKALQNLPTLKENGIHIHYQTKINGQSLT
jgi:type III restriction enzyme